MLDRTSNIVVEIEAGLKRWQDMTRRYDDEIGKRYGLSQHELQAIGLVLWEGPQPASAIVRATGLTPAGVTTLLDRLESRNFIQRNADMNDRRRAIIKPSQAAQALADECYLPVDDETEEMLFAFTPAEQRAILRFIKAAASVQRRAMSNLHKG